MTNTIDRTKLKELAEAETDVEWFDEQDILLYMGDDMSVAAYIAATTPTTILNLLDELEQAEAKIVRNQQEARISNALIEEQISELSRRGKKLHKAEAALARVVDELSIAQSFIEEEDLPAYYQALETEL